MVDVIPFFGPQPYGTNKDDDANDNVGQYVVDRILTSLLPSTFYRTALLGYLLKMGDG